jgi:hypothetical protein
LNPAVITLGCPTPQICVKECPKKTSIALEDRKLFCSSDGLCPKYVLQSTDFLGRCIPSIEGSKDEKKDNETIINTAGKKLTQKQIKDASKRLMIFMSARDFFENAITDVKET